MMEFGVAVNTGGACGGVRRCAGAIVAVVSSRVFVGRADQVGILERVGVLVRLKWFTRDERREVVGDMRKIGGARMREMQRKRSAAKERRRGRERKHERASVKDWFKDTERRERGG